MRHAGRHLLTSGADGHMRMWNPSSFELEVVNFGKFPQGETSCYRKVQVAVSWQSRLVFHPRQRDVVVSDLLSVPTTPSPFPPIPPLALRHPNPQAQGDRLATLPGHLDTVKCCVAQPRGEAIFSGVPPRHLPASSACSACHCSQAGGLCKFKVLFADGSPDRVAPVQGKDTNILVWTPPAGGWGGKDEDDSDGDAWSDDGD